MIFYYLICYILSCALSVQTNMSILYSRSTLITNLISLYIVYILVDWYFFKKTISLFNGLIYCSLTILVLSFTIILLSFLIKIITSFYNTMLFNFQETFGFLDRVSYSMMLNNKNITASGNEEANNELNLGLKKKELTEEEKTNEKKIDQESTLNLEDLLQIKREHYKLIEYSLITQFIIVGGITLLSSNDLITIFLAIELQSYGLYILCTLYRNSESSTSAGLTYFLLGGLSSCIILLGLSFLYVNSGTTNLDSIYSIHDIIVSENNLLIFIKDTYNGIVTSINNLPIFTLYFYLYAMQFSLVILSIGFLFKISAAPFHSWSPGVYDAIPTVTTTFVAIIPKISILILLFDIVYSTWYTTFSFSWTNIFFYSSFLCLVIGSILGLTQFRIKRLYAYSTISHVGFILLSLCVHNVESIQAFLFYIIQYSFSNLNAFIILILIGYTYINYTKKSNAYETTSSIHKEYKEKVTQLSPIEYIDQIKGYFYLNPLLALSFAITLYSFIGIPPLVGFFAKQMVLSSALDNGDVFMCLIAILTSVISAVYYLYIVKHMFFEKTDYMLNSLLINSIKKQSYAINILSDSKKAMIALPNTLTNLISILSLLIFLFIFLYYEIYFLMNIVSILIVY